MTDSPAKPDPTPATAVEAPPRIAGYRIERRLGQGGMATVWLAEQVSLARQVAIKVMSTAASADQAQAGRFEREARMIAQLDHPGIVGIHEVGRLTDGRPYYVMPYLPNGDLAHRQLHRDESAIVDVLRSLLEALAHAHAHAIVHRDVKPENVLFDANDRPRLADFGIALGRKTTAPRITGDGTALGSSGYMAPEQARGEEVDGRADLYSVGVVAFELLTGRLPFESTDGLTLALMHATDPVPPLPPNRRHWQPLVHRALAKLPDQRYRDARTMLYALDKISHRLRQTRRSPLARLLHPWLGGQAPLWLALASVLLLAVALVMGWSRTQRSDAPYADVAASAAISGPAPSDAPEIARLLDQAAAQLEAGDLVVPAGANAAESFLAVLRLQPGRADAMQGLREVFAGLASDMQSAVAAREEARVYERLHQAELLADGLGALGEEGLSLVRGNLQVALDDAVTQALARGARREAQASLSLLESIGLDGTAARAALAAPVRSPSVSAPATATPVGAPAPTRTARSVTAPVTVGEYRRFAEATGRPPARCRARLSPLQLLDKRDWRAPGFPQNDASPVVCVSHADAVAYAAWLSRQTGVRHRLPSVAERLAAGIGSPVLEWTDDCVSRGGRDCARRLVLQPDADGVGQSEAIARESDRGFDEVGIRLLRE